MSNIVILGWGSLIWDIRPEFSSFHGDWKLDGPVLPLEFARISSTREESLTLVLDERIGSSCQVAYARSSRSNPDDVIADLLNREGTSLRNIGYYFRDASRQSSRSQGVLAIIRAWADAKLIDVVVWTDLPCNFKSMSSQRCSFTTLAGMVHLRSLPVSAKSKAAEYLRRAPQFIDTPLRRRVQSEAWFQELSG